MMNRVLTALAYLLIAVSARAPTPKERLVNHVLTGYQRSVDPGNVSLEFGVYVQCAHFDSQTGITELSLWEFGRWSDSRLAWNPREHANQQQLVVPLDLLWFPDVGLNNALSSDSDDHPVRAVISSNGTVFAEKTFHYRVRCLKAGNNGATCKLYYGSWAYSQSHLTLRTLNSGVDLDFYDDACPSIISSHTATITNNQYPGWPEIYPSLDIEFVTTRRA